MGERYATVDVCVCVCVRRGGEEDGMEQWGGGEGGGWEGSVVSWCISHPSNLKLGQLKLADAVLRNA